LLASRFGDVFNVKDFGALGNGAADDTAAIQAACDQAAIQPVGTVYVPHGTYITTAPLLVENAFGVRIIGDSQIGSLISGSHTGKAILSLVGSRSIQLSNLCLTGSIAARPKTGLLLGRSSAGNAGYHSVRDLLINGSYAKTGLYIVASEENEFSNVLVVTTDAPAAAAYISYTDTLGVGGLTTSTMTQLTFTRCGFYQNDATAGNTTLHIQFDANTGNMTFTNLFLAKNGGDSFINFTLDAYGRNVTFNGVAGEAMGTLPTNGLRLQGTPGMHFSHFIAEPIGLQALTNAIKCDAGLGQFHDSRIHWTPTVDGQTMALNAAYGSELLFLNNGPITFDNGLYASTLIHNSDPADVTINISRAGSIIREFTNSHAGRVHMPIVATGSLPAAGAVEDGSVLIEDNGTGNRNLIIYAGGQRFRLDGGAAF